MMMLKEDEEWGPVIQHDGKGCPPEVLGKFIRVRFLNKTNCIMERVTGISGGWRWGNLEDRATWSPHSKGNGLASPIVEYQFKKPSRTEKGMSVLKDILLKVEQGASSPVKVLEYAP